MRRDAMGASLPPCFAPICWRFASVFVFVFWFSSLTLTTKHRGSEHSALAGHVGHVRSARVAYLRYRVRAITTPVPWTPPRVRICRSFPWCSVR